MSVMGAEVAADQPGLLEGVLGVRAGFAVAGVAGTLAEGHDGERYARPGPGAVARHVAATDPAARRRPPAR